MMDADDSIFTNLKKSRPILCQNVMHLTESTSNIDIYPSTLVFVENIEHKYDFHGNGWSLVESGVGGGPGPKKISFNRILILIYFKSMLGLSFQSVGCNPTMGGI